MYIAIIRDRVGVDHFLLKGASIKECLNILTDKLDLGYLDYKHGCGRHNVFISQGATSIYQTSKKKAKMEWDDNAQCEIELIPVTSLMQIEQLVETCSFLENLTPFTLI